MSYIKKIIRQSRGYRYRKIVNQSRLATTGKNYGPEKMLFKCHITPDDNNSLWNWCVVWSKSLVIVMILLLRSLINWADCEYQYSHIMIGTNKYMCVHKVIVLRRFVDSGLVRGSNAVLCVRYYHVPCKRFTTCPENQCHPIGLCLQLLPVREYL